MTAAVLYFITAAAIARLARIGVKPAVFLLLLPLAFTGKALLTGRVYAPIDLPYVSEPLRTLRADYGVGEGHNGLLSDVYSHNIPWKYAVRDAYRRGEAPLWNRGIFAGDVLAAAAQPAAYDPLLLLSLLVPLANSLTFLASMTFFLAGLGMYALLRDLRCSEWASLIGAAAWMFSLFLAIWIEWALGATNILLPLLLLGVRRVIRRGELALLTLAFVLVLLAGHPESALHVVALGVVWAAFESFALRGKGLVRATLRATLAGVLALGICAIYLLPVMEALPQTYEHEMRQLYYAMADKSPPLPLALERLGAQLVPFKLGMPEHDWPENLPFEAPLESAYCGSAALALAALGLWRSRARVKWAALAFVFGGIVFAVELSPFADLLGMLPLFDIALNERLVVAAVLGISILAALGADAFDRRAAIIASLAAAFVLAIAVAIAWSGMRELGLTTTFLRTQTAMLIGGALLVTLISGGQALLPLLRQPDGTATGRSACPPLIAALLLGAIVGQRVLESGDLYPTLPARAFYPPIPVLSAIPKSSEPFRIVGQYAMLIPNTATLYGLEDVRGYQALKLKRWVETLDLWSVPQGVWWNRVDDLTRPFLSLLNVRYALAPDDAPVPSGWRKLAQQPGTQLLENTRVLGRAFVPRRVRLGYPKDIALAEMRAQPDFAGRAWIDASGSPREELNGPGRVRIEQRGTHELLLHASMTGGGWVVVSQTAWNGWRATIDGKRAAIRYANHALLGIYVPQGEHVVRVVYRPRAFVTGAWISAASLVLAIVLLIAARVRLRSA